MSRPAAKSKHERKQAKNLRNKLNEFIPGTTCTENEWNQVLEREQSKEVISKLMDDFKEQLNNRLLYRSMELYKYKFAVELFQKDIIHMFEWSHAERDKEVDGTYFIDLDDFEPACLMTDNIARGSVDLKYSGKVYNYPSHNLGESIVSKSYFDKGESLADDFKEDTTSILKENEPDENKNLDDEKDKNLGTKTSDEKQADDQIITASDKTKCEKYTTVEKKKPSGTFVASELRSLKKTKKSSLSDSEKQMNNIISNIELNLVPEPKSITNFHLREEIIGVDQPSLRNALATHTTHEAIAESNTDKIVKNFDFRPQKTITQCHKEIKTKKPITNLLDNRVNTKVTITEKNVKELQKESILNPIKNLTKVKSRQYTFVSNVQSKELPNVQPCLNMIDAINPSRGVTITHLNKSKTNPLKVKRRIITNKRN
ncbi:hypothetical protein HELRODRAFT_176305 [Helobdella robusta]|uniref:Uncharacterized protein n=1 Tax=Helobdella robusta TaxID=6412 RepID=T1FAD6_HELRO|nr:hypothetical protein HELRODRAFT_176305 [Helobdella robusta]ESO00004.1 hypothetical protein HELRODRAFT_176305 [Helobdella robusta]